MKKIFSLIPLVLILFACSQPDDNLESTEVEIVTPSQVQVSQTPFETSTPQPSQTAWETLVPSNDIILTPTTTLPSQTPTSPGFFYDSLPEGMYLVSVSETQLFFRDISGSIVQTLYIGERIPDASYSDLRNEIIFSTNDGNVKILNLDKFEIQTVDDLHLAIGPTWTSDGSGVFYSWHGEEGEFSWSGVINLYDFETSNIIHVTDETINAFDAKNSPDGNWIAFLSDSFSTQATQYRLLILDSACLAQSIGNTNCMQRIEVATDAQYSISAISWSPDSKKIALSCFSLVEGISGVCVYNLGTGRMQRIYQSETEVYGVSWSPDGEWIAITEGRNNNSYFTRIALIRFDGTEHIIFKSEEYEFVSFWIEVE